MEHLTILAALSSGRMSEDTLLASLQKGETYSNNDIGS